MKFAQIGLGRIGFALESDPLRYKPCTHLGTILRMQEKNRPLQILALCDINPKAIQEVQKSLYRHNEILFTKDYRDVLSLEPDFLVIASSTSSHFTILKEAIHKKIPKILVEKPLVMNKTELKKIKKIYKRHSSLVWLNYERRYYDKYILLKEKIQNEYGKVISYRGLLICPSRSFYPYTLKNAFYEGLLLHDTTHLLDLVIFFFGVPIELKQKSSSNNENTHRIFLEHTNKRQDQLIQGEIVSIRHPKVFHFELEIITEKVRVIAVNGGLRVEKIKSSKDYANFDSFDLWLNSSFRRDKIPILSKNPFMSLYHEILSTKIKPDKPHKDTREDNFYESCKNVEILL